MESEKLEEAIKTVRKFNQENRYRDCGKINNSIDMVLQKLDYYKREYEVSQLQLHLLREETNNQINNSIPKEKVKEKIEKLDKEYKEILSDYGNIDTDITFNIPNENVRKHLDELVVKIIVLQELLEE